MTNKYVLIKISGIMSILVAVLLYFLLYFIPSLKAINRYKRQVKDINLRMSDFMKEENAFSFSTEKEKGYFQKVEQELLDKLPEVKSREDFISLFTRISDQLKQQAEQDGIRNLVLKSDSKDLQVNAGTISSDSEEMQELQTFTNRRMARLKKEAQRNVPRSVPGSGAPKPTGLQALVPNLKYHTVSMSFTGEIGNALNFINHIPWNPYFVSQDRILVSAGESFPIYMVFLKIYYIDQRTDQGRNLGSKP
jgi:hypothetical protein